MKKLKILNASNYCGIDQQGIDGLNLVELIASNNHKIKNDRNRFPISIIFQKNNTQCVLLFFKMYHL